MPCIRNCRHAEHFIRFEGINIFGIKQIYGRPNPPYPHLDILHTYNHSVFFIFISAVKSVKFCVRASLVVVIKCALRLKRGIRFHLFEIAKGGRIHIIVPSKIHSLCNHSSKKILSLIIALQPQSVIVEAKPSARSRETTALTPAIFVISACISLACGILCFKSFSMR